MDDNQDYSGQPKLVSNRAMDLVVALLFLAVSAVAVYDSARLGFGWQEGLGPSAGYFPFYLAVIMAAASLVNLVRAILDKSDVSGIFVSRPAFGRVIAVLVPMAAYTVAIAYIGIYVSSAVLIAFFMMFFGRYNVIYAFAVGSGTAIVLFPMFEKWFLVPLPKGPVEAWFGF